MYSVASNVMVVGKDSHTWDDGSSVYRVQLSNGLGNILTSECDAGLWNQFVALDKRYDVEIDVYTNGYKTYSRVVTAAEV